ncbi:MAG: hypothetical protein RSC93_10225 [Erysipelotrichaceae bacterium]
MIKEFPKVLARLAVDPSDFTCEEIREKIIVQGDDYNGTVRYATRRIFIASFTFKLK